MEIFILISWLLSQRSTDKSDLDLFPRLKNLTLKNLSKIGEKISQSLEEDVDLKVFIFYISVH